MCESAIVRSVEKWVCAGLVCYTRRLFALFDACEQDLSLNKVGTQMIGGVDA